MIKIFKIFLIAITTILFCSCTQKKSALVVNRGKYVYDRQNQINKDKYQTKNTFSSSVVIVSSGDTIYSISRSRDIPLRDLISVNNLQPPYILKIGDKINLPTAQYYQVQNGDTLFSISRKYQMNVNSLIELNDLKEPYAVRIGERIRVRGEASVVVKNSINSNPPKIQSKNLAEPKEEPAEEIKIVSKNNRFMWPIKGSVISKFGPKKGGLYNDGINIKAKAGDNVKAAEDGVVAYTGNELRGYGNLIIVKHSGGWISAYAHLSESKVKRGSKVKKGQTIAQVGSTGNVKSPQLYFGLRKGREAVNPQMYL